MKGTFEYTGSHSFDFGDVPPEFKGMNGKFNYSGEAVYAQALSGGDGLIQLSNTYAIEPLNEVKIYLFASIPDKVAKNFKKGTLVWSLPDGVRYELDLKSIAF